MKYSEPNLIRENQHEQPAYAFIKASDVMIGVD